MKAQTKIQERWLMGSIARQSGRPHGSDGSGASGISKNKVSKIRKNTAMMRGEGEVGSGGGAKIQAAVTGRGGTGSVLRASRPPVEAGGRSEATQDSNRRL